MNIECDQCKRQVQVTQSNQAIRNAQDRGHYHAYMDWSSPGIDSIAWACNTCLQIYCTACCFHHQPGEKKDLPDILQDPKCPFCVSHQLHFASQEDIETWDYFRPKSKKKNKGCAMLFGFAGSIIAVFLIIIKSVG